MNALFELFELLWVTLNEIELVQKAIQFFYLTANFEITFGGFRDNINKNGKNKTHTAKKVK
jgi:hypothetical protein